MILANKRTIMILFYFPVNPSKIWPVASDNFKSANLALCLL